MTAKEKKSLHIAVLMGGWSAEREVSLSSGTGVADALEKNGHEVTRVDMDRNVAQVLTALRPDVVFNALHGVPGEDGSVQGMLDLMQIPYTHSGLAKIVSSASLYEADPLPRPYVLKPVNEGSSVGVAIVTDDSNYGNPIGRDVTGPWQEFDELLAEPFIKGRELTTAVLGGKALCVTELKTAQGFYDYAAKYTEGLTQHVCPADIPAEIEKLCLDYALRAHQVLGFKGTSRTDFRRSAWCPSRQNRPESAMNSWSR